MQDTMSCCFSPCAEGYKWVRQSESEREVETYSLSNCPLLLQCWQFEIWPKSVHSCNAVSSKDDQNFSSDLASLPSILKAQKSTLSLFLSLFRQMHLLFFFFFCFLYSLVSITADLLLSSFEHSQRSHVPICSRFSSLQICFWRCTVSAFSKSGRCKLCLLLSDFSQLEVTGAPQQNCAPGDSAQDNYVSQWRFTEIVNFIERAEKLVFCLFVYLLLLFVFFRFYMKINVKKKKDFISIVQNIASFLTIPKLLVLFSSFE